MKNNTHQIVGILVAITLVAPILASAQTLSNTDVTSQIQSLMTQITSLQVQIHSLMDSMGSTTHTWSSNVTNSANSVIPDITNTLPIHIDGSFAVPSTTPGVPNINLPCININRDLTIGSRGGDVSQVQTILAQNGFLPATSTTGFFGNLTSHAINQFAHSFGISGSGTGFVGSNIREFFRSHCGTPTLPVNSVNFDATTTWSAGGSYDGSSYQAGSATQSTNGYGSWREHTVSTTTHPCPQINNNSGPASVALALFEPHTILPLDMHPCIQSMVAHTASTSADFLGQLFH